MDKLNGFDSYQKRINDAINDLEIQIIEKSKQLKDLKIQIIEKRILLKEISKQLKELKNTYYTSMLDVEKIERKKN